MSNRNRNSNTSTRNASTTAATPTTPTTRQVTQVTQAANQPRQSQVSTTQARAAAVISSTPATPQKARRNRNPVTIRVRATGEEIRRVPVERSGYRVVRYEGRYHTVRGGGRTAPYIVGSEDSEDMLGRA